MNFKTFLEHFDTIAQAPNGIEKLRSLILDLAVRGKLVPQNSEDESVLYLLNKAWQNWSILSKQKKIKDLPKLEPLNQDEFYQLPQGWVLCRFGQAIRLINGRAYKQAELLSTGTPVIRIQNLNGGQDWYYSDLVLDADKYCESNDLLFAWSASFGPYIWKGPKAIYHYHIWKLDLSSAIDKKFAFYLLHHLTDEVKSQSHGLAMLHMTKAKMENWTIVLPPLAEQKRIVEKVDELMALCDRFQQSQETRDHLRQKLRGSAIAALMSAETGEEMQKSWSIIRDHWQTISQKPEDVGDLRRSILGLAVRGKLVPQKSLEEPAKILIKQIQLAKQKLVKEGKIKKTKTAERSLENQVSYSIPESWEWVSIDDISDIGTGSTPLTSNPEYYEDGSIPWITSTATSQDSIHRAETYITELALKDYRLRMYPPGCLIVALYGQGKTRGQISTLEISATINQACAAINLIEETEEHREFIRYVFKKKYEELRALAAGGAQPNLNVGKIKETLIPLPPLAEQKRIVAKVDELMQMCDRLEESLRQSQQRVEALAASAISHLSI